MDDPRLDALIDSLLDSHSTPEEVCSSCPELLPGVRRRWAELNRVRAELDVLFPPESEADKPSSQDPWEDAALPQLPGYEVELVLGRGGMGIVYRARHLRLNRPVALKMLLAGPYAQPEEAGRFVREAETVAGLRHPNIVQVYEAGDVDGRSYFTMELVEGGNLAEQIRGVPQPIRKAAALVATLADAVHAAHQSGIVHRDLKPANILLTADGTPKVTDFGLARRLQGEGTLTLSGIPMGTPSYMAPEQAQGQRDAAGPATDVYALGAILYELLTGRPPFRAATAAETVQQVIAQEPAPPSRLNAEVPRDLETICLKCLHKDSRARYGTATDLADDLLHYLRGEPIRARRAGPVERLVKWTRRRPSLAASLVIGTLLVTVLLGVGGWAYFERTALKRAVNEDLDQIVLAQREKKWDQARTSLERARTRLGGGGPPDLRDRAAQLGRELSLVETLEEIFVSSLGGEYSPEASPQQTAARYEQALRAGELVNGPEDASVVAARIRATGISAPVIAALDDWAFNDEGRREWLRDVARQADEDRASRPLRESKLWENQSALDEFARSAPLANQSVPFLLLLGQELIRRGGDSVPYYRRIQQAHVSSPIANFAFAIQLSGKGNYIESLRYFQAAIALRPSYAIWHHHFGQALVHLGRWDEALVEFEEAVRLDPESAHFKSTVGRVLANMNRPAEAERQLRSILKTHPTYGYCLESLGFCLFQQGRHAEAIETFRRAIAADPKYESAYRQLKNSLLTLRRWDEARDAWQHWQTVNPQNHEAWDGYAELCLYLGNEAEYRRARTELLRRFGNATDPQVAERTGRACLFLPASDDELKQATALIDRAFSVETPNPPWLKPYFRFAKALAEYRADRAKNSLELLQGDTLGVLGPGPRLLLAMVQHRLDQTDAARKTFDVAIAGYDWDPAKVTNRESWIFHLLRREAETVLASKPGATGKESAIP